MNNFKTTAKDAAAKYTSLGVKKHVPAVIKEEVSKVEEMSDTQMKKREEPKGYLE